MRYVETTRCIQVELQTSYEAKNHPTQLIPAMPEYDKLTETIKLFDSKWIYLKGGNPQYYRVVWTWEITSRER